MASRLYLQVLPWAAAACFSAALVLGALCLWLWRRPRRRLEERRRQGQLGERQAAVLLERAGYRVVASQHAGSFDAHVDGERQRFTLRADYLVQRRSDGRLLLAEVKTGAVAPRLEHGPTRRQLLEYALAYGDQVAGVLLVAPERAEVTCVSFPSLRPLKRTRWPMLALGFLLGVLSGGAAAALHALLRR